MNKTIIAIAVVSLFSHASISHAQEMLTDDTMVVLARSDFNNSIDDIPANVTVIDANDIVASGATTLESLLRGRAGIQVSDTNSGPVFSIRGFNGSQGAHNTLILVDGRRLNRQDLSAPQLSSILLSQVERIEVLSGSAGVLYGDQAVGGVINIITKGAMGNNGELTLGLGSFDSLAGSINVSSSLNDNWGVFFSASQDNSDNYRDHNRRETGFILGRLSYAKGVSEFFVEASYYDNYREYAGYLTEEQYLDDPTQANAFYTEDYGHDITKAARVGYKYNPNNDWAIATDFIYDQTSGSGIAWDSTVTDMDEQLFASVKAEHRFGTKHGQANLLFGLEGANKDYTYYGSGIDRSNEQNSYSLYGQLNYPLTNKLTLITGGRYSAIEDNIFDGETYLKTEKLSESQDAYELGVNYKLNETQRVYLRGETNFRFAKVDEQAYTSPGVLGLKPQTGQSIEAGWGVFETLYSLKVDLFNLKLEDEIIYDNSAETPIGGAFPGANVNADKSERNGAGVTGDLYLFEGTLLGAEYHFIDAEFTAGDNKGNKLPWVARHNARLFANYEMNYEWQLYIEGVYTGSRYKDGDNANSAGKLSAYWLSNIALSYTKPDWSATLRVNNALDEKYPASVIDWGAYYPGDGRKVMLTGAYYF